MARGLVLEGGAMRGLFTAGVLDVLMENDIEFDGVIGVSAGACFGCNYITKQIGRTIRYNLQYAKDERYCSVKAWLRDGDIYPAEFCYHTLPETLDVFDKEAFEKASTDFYVVATDMETGKAVYHKIDTIDYTAMEWIRASASMPLFANIVEANGGLYLDGGVADSIPVKAFQNMGYDSNVTVLTKPRGYRKSNNKLMPLYRHRYVDYPEFVKAIEERHINYNEQLRDVFEAEKAGTNFVICPKSPLPIGHITHDRQKIKETYELGRTEATELLPALYRFLESRG